MAESGVLQNHKNWDNIFQLKLEHIKSQVNVAQRIFYSFLAVLFALLIYILKTVLNSQSGFLEKTLWMFFFIIVTAIVIWSFSTFLQDKIKSYYNELFYELLVGHMKNIQGISNKKYKELTEHHK